MSRSSEALKELREYKESAKKGQTNYNMILTYVLPVLEDFGKRLSKLEKEGE